VLLLLGTGLLLVLLWGTLGGGYGSPEAISV
jgi:hypothetical protein